MTASDRRSWRSRLRRKRYCPACGRLTVQKRLAPEKRRWSRGWILINVALCLLTCGLWIPIFFLLWLPSNVELYSLSLGAGLLGDAAEHWSRMRFRCTGCGQINDRKSTRRN